MPMMFETASLSPANIPIPLGDRYRQVRQTSEEICQPLATEDYVIQTMPDVSPPKWHLAHTTWFFETFLLVPYLQDYQLFNPQFGYLFNSYYEAIGERHPRAQRGLLSRPTVAEVYEYRDYVDRSMQLLIAKLVAELVADNQENSPIEAAIVLGLHHEQQHQELLLTDIKHILATNPLRPSYSPNIANISTLPEINDIKTTWLDYQGGLYTIGDRDSGFAFDNESPPHRVYLQDYCLASHLVTNGEYLEFIEAGGYDKPEYWLAEGWATVKAELWQAPLYWEKRDGIWWIMTLAGMRQIAENEPVCHVSFYEADAYASFRGNRLPTEAEWEIAASRVPIEGNFWETGILHPSVAKLSNGLRQIYGDVWEWTQSAYLPYPGFRVAEGAIGEYNGKFMCNQMVLRGGSCATSKDHIRATYRNFFPPAARWQFTGIRLAK